MPVVPKPDLRQYTVEFIAPGPVGHTRYTDSTGSAGAYYPYKSGSPQLGKACCWSDAPHEHRVEVYVLAHSADESRALTIAAMAQAWVKGFRVVRTAIKRRKVDQSKMAFSPGVTYMGEM